ncbi:MAG: thioredoxin family protein [Rhizobiales bacterium]|nr:thioredoxin family protein [Hyphomicrobiales bacterium]
MLTRREILLGTSAAVVSLVARSAIAEPVLTAEGLYSEPWFLQSFLDLRNDLEEATKKGKRLAIMWSLKGCPYCKETHVVNFGDQAIVDYVRAHFEILQLNYIGSLPVTDFDGQSLSEKDLARKNNVRFTPTFQFFSEPKTPNDKVSEVARLPGYIEPQHFLAMFRFVKQRAYDRMTFGQFVKNGGT